MKITLKHIAHILLFSSLSVFTSFASTGTTQQSTDMVYEIEESYVVTVPDLIGIDFIDINPTWGGLLIFGFQPLH